MPDPRYYNQGTRMALATFSRGTCYFPGCSRPIVVFENGEPYVDCQIAHIHDAHVGNRYLAKMTDDDRRSFANLILLCKPHHELVDKRHPGDYPSAVLAEWKANKEADLPAADLTALLEDDVIRLMSESDTYILGGTGGSAPGAGGGGGAALGQGATGGPGGQGGDTYILDGRAGSAPGAGGGGGGSVGPGAIGGEGGEGGEFVSARIELTDDIVGARVHVGRGGEGGIDGPGSQGEETSVEFIRADGSVAHVIRAAPGRPGAAGSPPTVPVTVVGAMLCNSVELTNGLLYILGGGWGRYEIDTVPATLIGCLVGTVESDELGLSEVRVRIDDPGGEVASMIVPISFADHSIQLVNFVQPFAVPIQQQGRWAVSIDGTNATLTLSIDVIARTSPETTIDASTREHPMPSLDETRGPIVG